MPNLQTRTPLSDLVYLVLDDFGALGRAYRETDEDRADRETLIRQMMEGQFNAPVRVIAFSVAEGWVRDVSTDVAVEIDCRARRDLLELGPNVVRFVARQLDLGRQYKVGCRRRHRSECLLHQLLLQPRRCAQFAMTDFTVD